MRFLRAGKAFVAHPAGQVPPYAGCGRQGEGLG